MNVPTEVTSTLAQLLYVAITVVGYLLTKKGHEWLDTRVQYDKAELKSALLGDLHQVANTVVQALAQTAADAARDKMTGKLGSDYAARLKERATQGVMQTLGPSWLSQMAKLGMGVDGAVSDAIERAVREMKAAEAKQALPPFLSGNPRE